MTQEYAFDLLYKTYGYSKKELSGANRLRELAMTRMVASYLLVVHCETSRVKAGKLINRDHSTVIYHLERIGLAMDGFDTKLLKHLSKIKDLPFKQLEQLLYIKQKIYQNPSKSFIEILKASGSL